LPKIIRLGQPRNLFPLVLAFFLVLEIPALFSSDVIPSDNIQKEIIASLESNASALGVFKASVEIGVPNSASPLIQWVNGLVAYRKNPEFLYLKGYKPLVPLYFLLISRNGRFSLFFPRSYKVYTGENSVLEQDPDLAVTLIAQDIIDALALEQIDPSLPIEWLSEDKGYRLTFRNSNGQVDRELTLDAAYHVRRSVHYNQAGFSDLEITRNDWRSIKGRISFPFKIKIKRFLPKPNDLIIRFKEIRTDEDLGPEITDYPFPKDATYVELREGGV